MCVGAIGVSWSQRLSTNRPKGELWIRRSDSAEFEMRPIPSLHTCAACSDRGLAVLPMGAFALSNLQGKWVKACIKLDKHSADSKGKGEMWHCLPMNPQLESAVLFLQNESRCIAPRDLRAVEALRQSVRQCGSTRPERSSPKSFDALLFAVRWLSTFD
jgi:hypothetical protein